MRGSVLLLLAALLVPRAALAETATEALKARDAEVRAALPPAGTDPSPTDRTRLEALVTKAVDLEGMLKRAMGPQWPKATPSQRRRIQAAFERRFRRVSGGQLDRYRGTAISYGAETAGPDGEVSVPTRVVVNGEPTEIVYAMRLGPGGWRIEDVVVEGASTVDAFRSSFQKTIAKEGIPGLVAKLEKVAAEKPPRAAAPAPAASSPSR